MSIATTPARREIKINPKAVAIVQEWSMMEALARIEAKQQTLLERVGRMSAVLDDVTDLLTRPAVIAPIAEPSVTPPVVEEKHTDDRRPGHVMPIFRGMVNAVLVQSAARRVAGMAIIGRYDPAVLSPMYVNVKGIDHASEEQIEEMVSAQAPNWERLGALAESLDVRHGWAPSVIGTFLALLAWRDHVHDDATVSLVRRVVQPIDGTKAKGPVLVREFARAMDFMGTGPDEVVEALRYWANHCAWAHPDVRGVL